MRLSSIFASGRAVLSVFLLALLLGSTGCGRRTSDIEAWEEQEPLMVKAQARTNARDIDGAIGLYQQALEQKPRMAKPHLHLGLLYEQHRQDYVRAIYHYQRYLELRPDSEKRAFIEDLIAGARIWFAASLPDRPSEAVEQLATLKGQMVSLEQDVQRVRSENASLREQVRKARAALLAMDRGGTAVADGGAGTAGGAARPRTYTVRDGDTLSKIASRVYNDSSKYRRIFDANRDRMRSQDDLQPGQVLVIPEG